MMILSCKKSIKDDIAKKIQEKCKDSDACKVDLRDVTNFKWDSVYFFKEGFNLERMKKVLGFRYPYWEDVASRIVFVSGKKVVYHEDEFPDPDMKPKGGVVFNIYNNSTPYYSFCPSVAFFEVKKT